MNQVRSFFMIFYIAYSEKVWRDFDKKSIGINTFIEKSKNIHLDTATNQVRYNDCHSLHPKQTIATQSCNLFSDTEK